MARQQPMHLKIADELRLRVAKGAYDEDGLPPEFELMEEFSVSRHTIRSALQRLVTDGLIERRAGSGTRVVRKDRNDFWVIGSLNDLIGEFSPDQYLTLSADKVPARDFPHVAEMFGVPLEGELFGILRILSIKNAPYAVAWVFATTEAAGLVPKEKLGVEPLIHLIEKHAMTLPVRCRQMATATLADAQSARQIGVLPGSALLVLHRTYYDAEDRAIVHTELLCRPDRYVQVVDFVHEEQTTKEEAGVEKEMTV